MCVSGWSGVERRGRGAKADVLAGPLRECQRGAGPLFRACHQEACSHTASYRHSTVAGKRGTFSPWKRKNILQEQEYSLCFHLPLPLIPPLYPSLALVWITTMPARRAPKTMFSRDPCYKPQLVLMSTGDEIISAVWKTSHEQRGGADNGLRGMFSCTILWSFLHFENTKCSEPMSFLNDNCINLFFYPFILFYSFQIMKSWENLFSSQRVAV